MLNLKKGDAKGTKKDAKASFFVSFHIKFMITMYKRARSTALSGGWFQALFYHLKPFNFLITYIYLAIFPANIS